MIAVPSRATSSARSASDAIADDGVLRVGEHVEDRRVVERDADGVELGGQRPRRSAPPALVAGAPARPSVAIGGHSVNGRFSRATRPPS